MRETQPIEPRPAVFARKVVLLASPEWPGRYMASALARAKIGLEAVIIQNDSLDDTAWSWRNFRRAATVDGFRPALEAFVGFRHGVRHWIGRWRDRDRHPEFSDVERAGVPVHRVPAFISEECGQLLRRLAPDVAVICGTPILPHWLLAIPRICCLNIHTSVLPHYRGGGSLFWPLFFRDHDKVGYTIHKAVAQVDAGPFLVRESIGVGPADTPDVLLRRLFTIAVPRLATLLRDSPLDERVWQPYEHSVAHAWRAPTDMVRRAFLGSSVRHQLTSRIKEAVYRTGFDPFAIGKSRPGDLAIFYFHRALSDETPATDWRRALGHPTVSELRERILYLRRRFELISLSTALDLLARRKPLDRHYAVLTVDDGYRDFRTNLLPLLTDLRAPSTLFVCTGPIESDANLPWFMRLYGLIDHVKTNRIFVPWVDRHLWFGDVRQRVMTIEYVLAPYLKRLSRAARAQRIAELVDANCNGHSNTPTIDRMCTVDDLLELKQSELVELHLHSHNHDPYETLNDEELVADVQACRGFCRDRLGIDSGVISYPNGHIRPGQAAILQRLAIRYGLTTRNGLESPASIAPFSVHRVGLTNEPMAALHWSICRLSQA